MFKLHQFYIEGTEFGNYVCWDHTLDFAKTWAIIP